MVQSNGNGSYIINKRLWQAAVGLILLLLGVVAYGGEAVMDDVTKNREAIQKNEVIDAIQSERIGSIKETLDRMEATINAINSRVK